MARKSHPVWIRMIGQNHRIVWSDVSCTRLRCAGRQSGYDYATVIEQYWFGCSGFGRICLVRFKW